MIIICHLRQASLKLPQVSTGDGEILRVHPMSDIEQVDPGSQGSWHGHRCHHTPECGQFGPRVHQATTRADDSGGDVLIVVQRPGRIPHAVQVLNQEPPTRSKLTAPPLGHVPGIGEMRQEQPGVDDVGRCTREWQCNHIVRLEPGGRDTGSGAGDERFGCIDTDDGLGSEHLNEEFGGEARSAAEVDDHLRERERIGGEELARA